LKNKGSSIQQVISFANIMMYDDPPSNIGFPSGYTLETYKYVFDAYEEYMNKE